MLSHTVFNVLPVFIFLSALLGILEAKPLTIGYYPNWAIYDTSSTRTINDLPLLLLDEVIYAFSGVDKEGHIQMDDPDVDLGLDGLSSLKRLKEKASLQGHPLQVLLSIGGWGSGSLHFDQTSSSSKKRKQFAREALALCLHYELDGIDIDWEFPKNLREGKNLFKVVVQLHRTFKEAPRPLKITMAAPGIPSQAELIPWPQIAPYLDQVHVMTYSLHGPWKDHSNGVTNHQCAFLPPSIGDPALCVTAVMSYYKRYFPLEKLIVGVPLFFNTYADAKEGIKPSHYGSPYSGPLAHPKDPDLNGLLLYREVAEMFKAGKLEGFCDEQAIAYSIYDKKQFFFGSGINDEWIEKVVLWTIENQFGGVMLWELSADTSDWKVLNQIHQLFMKPPNRSQDFR